VGFFDRFESAVEKGVNSVFSRVFRSGLKSVDVSSALKRKADDGVGSDGTAPNDFKVFVAPKDYASLGEDDLELLSADLEQEVTAYARQQGYALLGPVEVAFVASDRELTGNLEVEALSKRGPAAPATTASASPEHPIIDVNGEKWLLTEPVTVLGRGREADITVDDTGVSRRHAELRVTPTGVIITDLGSTNGTFVEGHKVDAATLVDGNQIVIGRTPILFWTHAED
jgi:FOG: FHA domain